MSNSIEVIYADCLGVMQIKVVNEVNSRCDGPCYTDCIAIFGGIESRVVDVHSIKTKVKSKK